MALFDKALNSVDIEQGLELDPECAGVLPRLGRGQMMDLLVTDGRNVLHFLYSLTAGSPPKPKFSGGWIEFARNLKPGNKVYFYGEEDEATGAQYRVVVRG